MWPLVEADLHQTYGIDLGDSDLLSARSWDWLRVRINGLLNSYTVGPDGTAIPTTRVGWILNPPKQGQPEPSEGAAE